jgi:TonB-dependent SusC/RagA subfamily outer membrane receptor
VSPAGAAPRSVLTEEDIRQSPGRPIEDLLMDRFPGVIVARTNDGGISIRIHGTGSLMGSSEPLYVIDEVPMQLDNGAALRAINPLDIVFIEVVKDPVGTALYGVRGANGVIIIKTKRASPTRRH